MANRDTTLNRRQLAAFSAAAFAAIPVTALDAAAPLNPTPIADPVFRLIEEHHAAEAAFDAASRRAEDLEDNAPAHVEIYYYNDASELAGFHPERVARIEAGDRWAIESGLDAAIEARNAALERIDTLEIMLKTEPPTSMAGLIALVEWLDAREVDSHCGGPVSPLEAADRQTYRTIIASLRSFEARA